MKTILLLAISLFFNTVCLGNTSTLVLATNFIENIENKKFKVAYNNENLVFEGRMETNDQEKYKEFFWSGSSITFDMYGTSVEAKFSGMRVWDKQHKTQLNVFVDGEFQKILTIEDGEKDYTIIENLNSEEKHTISITKRNEWTATRTKFYGFTIVGKELVKRAEKELFIEFYGDSITAGMGNEDPTKNDAITNNYWAYGAITARNLNASYSCIARSGIGLKVSWYNLIMPEMYNYQNPYKTNVKWDFTKKQPQVVVINILQNDSWIVKLSNHEEFKRRFGKKEPKRKKYIKSYINFVKTIRAKYPKASIICMLGNMDITKEGSVWPQRVKKAVSTFKENVYYLESPFIPANGHPKVTEHKKSAVLLTKFIQKNILK